MSHLKEREEKNCLNCNAQVQGKFCHVCGQENIHPKDSVWHLVSHFFQDVTHFDGKFFSTIKLLIFRPGFLSTEYAQGRRTNYLNPIRLYVFTSAFFFLIFFSFVQKDEEETADQPQTVKEVINKLEGKKIGLQKAITFNEDSEDIAGVKKSIQKIDRDIAILQKDSALVDSIKDDVNAGAVVRVLNNYSSQAAYDSLQKTLPENKKDGWMTRKMQSRMIAAKIKYHNNTSKIQTALFHKFKHYFPQLLFLSLPFFALALKILYIRRKQFFYVNHIIFTIHLYCAVFILLLLYFGFNGLDQILNWGIFDWITTIIAIGIFFYQYKAMRNFYQQRRFKTILKYVLLNFMMLFIMVFLIMGMLIFTAYQI